jgi:hypothetical protein
MRGAAYGLGTFLLATSVLFSSVARAADQQADSHADAAYDASYKEGLFGGGIQAGFAVPNGLVLRFGPPQISLEAAGGATLNLLSYKAPKTSEAKGATLDDGEGSRLTLISSPEVQTDLLVRVFGFEHGLSFGARGGYRFNQSFGHGASFGAYGALPVGRFLLEASFAIVVFPAAERRLRGDQVPHGTTFDIAPSVNSGLWVAILFGR